MPRSQTVADPVRQAYQLLHFAFVVAPIITGLEKYFQVLVNWEKYLASVVPATLHTNAHTLMMVVSVIEIIAGLIVAFKPRIGEYIVTLWLWGIIINLLVTANRYNDIALRDFGLSLGALALARLSETLDFPGRQHAPNAA